jgi:hypothetical protein
MFKRFFEAKAWLISALSIFTLLTLSTNSVLAAPKPSQAQVRQIINQEFSQTLMFFKPYDLPVEFERTHKAMVKKLAGWVKLGLVKQTKTRFLSEKMMYGSIREVSVGGYKYELNQDNQWVSEKGVFYGKPVVADIFEISSPSQVNNDEVSEVYFSWYAAGVPNWVTKIDLKERKHRQIKRAYESKKRPFEKRLYLVYRDKKWILWVDKDKQSLF